MITLQKSIETYIRAKDGNRPFLIADAFTADAELTMQVNTSEISFPATVKGAAAISTVLVSEFAQRYENVYTFCIGNAPVGVPSFECKWLVVMSEKATGLARVGHGRYEWQLSEQTGRLDALKIVIADMLVLPAETVTALSAWANSLPYPWCPPSRLEEDLPDLPEISVLREIIGELQHP